jgi:hypothetical protein
MRLGADPALLDEAEKLMMLAGELWREAGGDDGEWQALSVRALSGKPKPKPKPPPRPNATEANRLAHETWEALPAEEKPLGPKSTVFLIWRQRIEEALDAGRSPDEIRLAAREAGGTTRAMWDRAFKVTSQRRPPGAPIQAQERTGEAQRALARRNEDRRGGEPERPDVTRLLEGTSQMRRALQDSQKRRSPT